VATALLYGIRVDTKDFAREITIDDFEAGAWLLPQADTDVLERIETPSMSADTLDTIAAAIRNRELDGSMLASCVGAIADRDTLAQAADRLLAMRGVTVTFVYGFTEGTIYVSARSRGKDIDLGAVLREAFGDQGSAGGHADMAGAQLPWGCSTRSTRPQRRRSRRWFRTWCRRALRRGPRGVSFWQSVPKGSVMDQAFEYDGTKPKVEDYMTRDVATVSPDDSVRDVATRISESEHNGFPVCEGRRVEGFVSARDLLLSDPEELVFKAMSDELIVAHPEMKVTDAARVILRSGIQKLPVVDDAGNLVGIISNSDVIRSQIERATPEKVGKLKRTLETIHGIEATEERRSVRLADIVPTQGRCTPTNWRDGATNWNTASRSHSWSSTTAGRAAATTATCCSRTATTV